LPGRRWVHARHHDLSGEADNEEKEAKAKPDAGAAQEKTRLKIPTIGAIRVVLVVVVRSFRRGRAGGKRRGRRETTGRALF